MKTKNQKPKTKKVLIFCLISAFSILTNFLSYSQKSLDATVVASYPLNTENNRYFLYESSKAEYYESAITSVQLNINEGIRIWIPANSDSLYLAINDYNQKFYVKKIQDPNTQLPLEVSFMLPYLDNEILFFDNKEQLTGLYDLTQNYINKFGDNDSLQSFLNSIEKIYGDEFISYRKHFSSKYPPEDAYSNDQLNQISRENFISDDILNTYFNHKHLIGLGDSVYYYNNRQEILSVHKNNNGGIEYLKTISLIKDNNVEFIILSDLSAKDLEIYGVSYISKKGKKGLSKGLIYSQNPQNTDWYFQTIPHQINEVENCNPYKKGVNIETWYGFVTTSGSTNFNYYKDGTYLTEDNPNPILRTVTLIINWGDGTPLQTVTNYTDLDDVYHEYPSGIEAQYQVYIETQLVDIYNGETISIFDGQGYSSSVPIVFIVGVACTDKDKQEYNSKESGDWKMQVSGWVSHNFFGSHIGGYTHAYKKQSNGSWKLDKAKIKVHVEGVFRQDDDCEKTKSESGTKENNNDKKVEKTKTKLWSKYSEFSNGDVKTTHRLIKGNVTITDELILNPCN